MRDNSRLSILPVSPVSIPIFHSQKQAGKDLFYEEVKMPDVIHNISERDGKIWIANDGDHYYEQCFESRKEIDKFIWKLVKMRNKVFPHKEKTW